MPLVPIEQNRVGIAEVVDAKLRPADFGLGVESVAAGLKSLGKGAVEIAQTISDYKGLIDETRAKALDVQGADGANAILRTGESAFYSRQGFDVQEGTKQADRQLNDLRAKLSAQAGNKRQRDLFLAVYDRRVALERQDMSRYALGQLMAGARAQSIARRATYAQEARTLGGDPERREIAVATGLREIEVQGAHEGWSDAVLEAEKAAYKSDIFSGIVGDQMIDDPLAAQRFLNDHADDITPDKEADLRKALRGPIRERRAFGDVYSIVQGPDSVGQTGQSRQAPLSSTSAVARKIISAESGGYALAKNPLSSASGVGQFTRRTFLDLYKQSYGDGGLSDDQIWSKRFEKRLGGKMTELLVTQNAGMLKAAGVQPNDASLYLAHFLGPRSASVIKADPSTPVANLLPREFIDSNPKVLGNGRTAGEVVQWADRLMGGEGARPTYSPKREDLDSIYQRIDAEPWDFDRKQAAREEADRWVGRQDRLVARQEDQAQREALDIIDRLGPQFTSMRQLGALTAQLSPETRTRLHDQARQNAEPKPIPANGEAVVAMHVLAESSPEQFMKTDLRLFQSQMTRGEYDQLATLRARMTAKPDSPAQVSHSRIWQQINFYGRDVGLNVGPKAKGETDKEAAQRRQDGMAVFSVMQSTIRLITEDKRPPSDDEIKRAFDNAILARANRGNLEKLRRADGSLPTNVVAVPYKEAAIIRAKLRAAGRPYDDQSVSRIYIQSGE